MRLSFSIPSMPFSEPYILSISLYFSASSKTPQSDEFIAAAITSQKDKSRLPTHISINADRCGLAKDSIVLLEQVRTLDKQRLKERMGELDEGAMNKVDNALSVSFGLSGNN